MGQNGREIPFSAPPFPADTDLLIVMLGTNDLLQGRSPEQAAGRLERFLSGISLAYDGVHFTEQGHRAFAAGLLEELGRNE